MNGGFPRLSVGLAAWVAPRAIAIVLTWCLSLSTPGTAAEPPTGTPTFHANLKIAADAAAADHSVVLAIFGANWCGPCKALKTRTLDSAEFLSGAGAVHIVEIDADEEPDQARDFAVQALPTLLLMTAEEKIVARRVGFVDAPTLKQWIEEGRGRVKSGEWQGTASSARLDDFVNKAAADRLTIDDLKRLIEFLDEPDPSERTAAGKLLVSQREDAVALLIEATSNAYLGRRIAASELLEHLAPTAPKFDPWRSPEELGDAQKALQKWWADTGKLPATIIPTAVDPLTAGSINAALAALRRNDILARTEAMSKLTAYGTTVLPMIREAIKAGEQRGDRRATTLLEDVRWAILVPDSLERRTDGVRAFLARGSGMERQAAAKRLSRGGREAIPALGELVNDADASVVESAIRALSNIGGKDSIPAMASLLKAADSNIRMTAAQALGHTKNSDAVTPLLAVLDDPNEIVVCTALGSIVELLSDRGYSTSKTLPGGVGTGIGACLADPRWRVRAAAAEAAGKLTAKELMAPLTQLLEDKDGFVVKNALTALKELGATLEEKKLVTLAGRHPNLRSDAVELLVKMGSNEAVGTVTEMYRAGGVEDRLAILQGLGANAGVEGAEWQPLLALAAVEPDARLRRAMVTATASVSAQTKAQLIGPLLSDVDGETRILAVNIVLSVVGGERLMMGGERCGGLSGWSSYLAGYDPSEIFNDDMGGGGKKAKTNAPNTTVEQIAAWHKVLTQPGASTSNPVVASAIYVTGHTNLDLPILQGALERADPASIDQLLRSPALAAVVPRLPWPDGRPVLDRICKSPALFVRSLPFSLKAVHEVADYLLDPERFRASLEGASGDELQVALSRLLNESQKGWSLLSISPQAAAVRNALIEAKNPAWRAAAIYALSWRSDGKGFSAFEKALSDTNAWVRVAAISAIVRIAKDRETVEARVAPLLADSDPQVARRAAIALLEPECRAAAGLNSEFDSFQFDNAVAGSFSSSFDGEQRPLAVLEQKPTFLEEARRRLGSHDPKDLVAFGLLLAQYGDFSEVERIVMDTSQTNDEERMSGSPSLAAIALSRDVKYLPHLRKAAEQAKEEYQYRPILQALRGISGPGARELRVEINRRLRGATE